MRGQLFGLIVSALLLGEAYGLWRPQALGGLPQPDLGPFSHYRLVIALLTAGVGAVVLLATLFRDRPEEAPRPRRQRAGPLTLDLGTPQPAPRAPPPQASPKVDAPPAVPRQPPRIEAPAPPPNPAPIVPPPAAPVPVEDIDELDPFPGLEPAKAGPRQPDPPPEPVRVAAAEPAPLPEPPPPPPKPPAPIAYAALEPRPAQAAPQPETPAWATSPLVLPPQTLSSAAMAAPQARSDAPRGDRGRYLDLTDEAQQYRASGNLDDAFDRYTSALAIARRRVAADPQDLVARRDLAAALTHVGEMHDRTGRLDTAIALHEESLGVRRRLADASGADIGSLQGLSTGLERLADAREARGHRSRARDLFRLRLQLAERLAAHSPGDRDLAAAVATTRERLAELDQTLAV